MDRARIAVIGLGFGVQHVRTLVNMPEAHLVAVTDRKEGNRVHEIAAQCGARAYTDAAEMLEAEELDAVSVCTAPHRREEIIELAARRGIALFVEKPWASDLATARRLAETCRAHNATVMAAFSFRFHPAVLRLRELMDAELGAGWLMSAEYVFGWTPPADGWLWRPDGGGGFFNENSCHLLDVVCYLMGDPVSVMAEASAPQGTPSENAGGVVIRFAGGGIATAAIGGVGAGGSRDYPRLHLYAANGEAELQGREHVWERVRWTKRGEDTSREFARAPEALGNTRYTDAFRHFFGCLREGKKPSATIEDGIRCVALAEAIYESARTGAKVNVSLEEG